MASIAARMVSANALLTSIAGGGFEPPTSGLWARRATRLLYPAVIQKIIPLNHLFSKNKTV